MKGYVYSYSERQLLIYNFIKRIGPSPEPALETLFGLHTLKALNKLKHYGYLQNSKLRGIDFWFCPDCSNIEIDRQETIAWFVARLEEAGGKFERDYGISPKGKRFMLEYAPGCIYIINENNQRIIARLEDLKRLKLADCLKWDKIYKTP